MPCRSLRPLSSGHGRRAARSAGFLAGLWSHPVLREIKENGHKNYVVMPRSRPAERFVVRADRSLLDAPGRKARDIPYGQCFGPPLDH